MSKIVTYFSASGVTARRAKELAEAVGSDISKAVKDLSKQYPQLKISGGKLLNGAVRGDIV